MYRLGVDKRSLFASSVTPKWCEDRTRRQCSGGLPAFVFGEIGGEPEAILMRWEPFGLRAQALCFLRTRCEHQNRRHLGVFPGASESAGLQGVGVPGQLFEKGSAAAGRERAHDLNVEGHWRLQVGIHETEGAVWYEPWPWNLGVDGVCAKHLAQDVFACHLRERWRRVRLIVGKRRFKCRQAVCHNEVMLKCGEPVGVLRWSVRDVSQVTLRRRREHLSSFAGQRVEELSWWCMATAAPVLADGVCPLQIACLPELAQAGVEGPGRVPCEVELLDMTGGEVTVCVERRKDAAVAGLDHHTRW